MVDGSRDRALAVDDLDATRLLRSPSDPTLAPLSTRLLADAVGSAFLVIAVIGSGIMAETA